MQERFQVDGMTCQHCVRAVREAIEDLDPDAQVAVDLPTGQVDVTATASRDSIRDAIVAAGYTAA